LIFVQRVITINTFNKIIIILIISCIFFISDSTAASTNEQHKLNITVINQDGWGIRYFHYNKTGIIEDISGSINWQLGWDETLSDRDQQNIYPKCITYSGFIPSPNQELIDYTIKDKNQPRIFITVENLNTFEYKEFSLVPGENNIIISDFSPGPYKITATTKIQVDEAYYWDTGVPSTPSLSMQQLPLPPINGIDEKGPYSVYYLKSATTRYFDSPELHWAYHLYKKYTYYPKAIAYTHIDKNEEIDDVTVVLITNPDTLAKIYDEISASDKFLTERIEAVSIDTLETGISESLKKHNIPKLNKNLGFGTDVGFIVIDWTLSSRSWVYGPCQFTMYGVGAVLGGATGQPIIIPILFGSVVGDQICDILDTMYKNSVIRQTETPGLFDDISLSFQKLKEKPGYYRIYISNHGPEIRNVVFQRETKNGYESSERIEKIPQESTRYVDLLSPNVYGTEYELQFQKDRGTYSYTYTLIPHSIKGKIRSSFQYGPYLEGVIVTSTVNGNVISTSSSSEGDYELTSLQPFKKYSITFRKDGFKEKIIETEGGAILEDIILEVDIPKKLWGIITDEKGTPISKAGIRATSCGCVGKCDPNTIDKTCDVTDDIYASSDKTGAFTINVLEYNVYYLEVSKTGYSNNIVEGKYGQSNDIVLIKKTPIDTTSRSILLVLDTSGSMKEPAGSTTKIIMVKKTADTLANLKSIYQNVDIGIVTFASEAKVDSPFSNADTNSIKQNIVNININNFNRCDSGACTSFGVALFKAIEVFDQTQQSTKKYIIFMSDGEHNLNPTPDSFIQECSERGITIHALGFGDEFDAYYLQMMADQTGGIYAYADNVMDFENQMIDQFDNGAGWQFKERYNGEISQGQTIDAGQFKVDSSIDSIKVTLNWPGSDLDLLLFNPKGTQITPTDPSVTFSGADSKPKYFIIKDPIVGDWTMKVFGKDVPESSTRYSLAVNDLPKSGGFDFGTIFSNAGIIILFLGVGLVVILVGARFFHAYSDLERFEDDEGDVIYFDDDEISDIGDDD